LPELPEVQTTVDGINKYVRGLSVRDVWTGYKSAYHTGKDNIKDPKYFKFFKKEIIGKKIEKASRRAKNVLIHLSDRETILIHMKMTGHILYGKYKRVESGEWIVDSKKENDPLKDPFNKFIRLAFTLSNGKHLVLSDMRRFAKITFIKNDGKEISRHLANLGPEPLEKNFTFKLFQERILKRQNGKIKIVLMDQSLIAGIGNIYSDEILWRAGVHPETRVSNISKDKLILIFKAIKDTLKKGIDFGGDSMSDYRNILGERGKFQEKHEAYRRTGLPCRKKGCGGKIIRKIVGQRSAHFCSTHQKLI